jgi:hypothetical protein
MINYPIGYYPKEGYNKKQNVKERRDIKRII